MDRYTPKVGEGAALRAALEEKHRVWLAQGLPGFQILSPFDGPHNSLVTVQRWDSFAQWEEIRTTLPGIPECRSVVFDVLYPTNAIAYDTQYFSEIS
jgi:hypothetical protein